MRPEFISAVHRLKLFPEWVTPFFRFSTALPRRRHLEEFWAPFAAGGIPVTVQIMGTAPAILAAGAREFAMLGAAGIDLNCGCPSRQVISGGAGGGMLRTPDRIAAILEAVKQAVGALPVSVKIRTGFERSEEMETLIPRLANLGVLDFMTLHHRTVREQYLPVAGREERWRRGVALAGELPVILNGDLTEAEAMRRWPTELGAAGAMAARGLLRDPWLLRRARGEAAPEMGAGREEFFAAFRSENPTRGQMIELSNFIWGKSNPYFAELTAKG